MACQNRAVPIPESDAALADLAAIADRLQDAIVAGDVETAGAIYAADLVVWHNYDRVDRDRAESLAAIGRSSTPPTSTAPPTTSTP